MTRSVREMIDFLMSILSTPILCPRVHADKTSNFVDLRIRAIVGLGAFLFVFIRERRM